MTINRLYLIIGAVFGFLGVSFGAFGAHALKSQLSPEMLDIYKTGVMYHFIHAVLITALALAGERFRFALLFFSIGIILFSFSLYLYTLTGITTFAMITPVGGVSLLAGWALVIYSAVKNKSKQLILLSIVFL